MCCEVNECHKANIIIYRPVGYSYVCAFKVLIGCPKENYRALEEEKKKDKIEIKGNFDLDLSKINRKVIQQIMELYQTEDMKEVLNNLLLQIYWGGFHQKMK